MPKSSSTKSHRPHSSELSRWFHRACKHEEGALQELLALYRPLLLRLARRRIKGALQAKVGASDVVQVTVIKATQHFAANSFTERKNFWAWLKTVLGNEVADARRRFVEADKRAITSECSLHSLQTKKWLNQLSVSLSDPHTVGDIHGVTVDHVLKGLTALPAHYQLVLRLCYYEKLSFEAIGKRLKRSPDSARQLRNRALKLLRSGLECLSDVDSRNSSRRHPLDGEASDGAI